MNKKFPYKVDLEQRSNLTGWPKTGYWYSDKSKHKEVIEWLKEFIGERRIDWYCLEAGYYLLKSEEDAVALKLRWL